MRKQSKRIAIILLIIMITGFIITFNIITANAATTFDSLKSKYQDNTVWNSTYQSGRAIECHGFALQLGYELTDTDPYTWIKYSGVSLSDYISSGKLKAGDIIRTFYDQHTIMVTDIKGTSLKYVDCNWPGGNVIHWDRNANISGNNISLFDKYYPINYVLSCPKTISGNGNNLTGYVKLWNIENNQEINEITKIWAKRFDNDTNHFAVFYMDDVPVTGHIQSDDSGYFSFSINPHDYTPGKHSLKVVYTNSNISSYDIINVQINNYIVLWDINNNQEINEPTKIWAKRFDNDTNHFAVFYMDDVPVTGHIQSDDSGYFSFSINPHDYTPGNHILKIVYTNSNISSYDIIKVQTNSHIVLWDINNNQEINETTKIWAKRFDNDTNHFAVFYMDDVPVTGHIQSDDSSYFSFSINPKDYALGEHTLKIHYVNSNISSYDTIKIIIKRHVLLMDINLDGKVSITDVTELQKFIANTTTLNNEQMAVADANKDGKINITDVTYIQQFIANSN